MIVSTTAEDAMTLALVRCFPNLANLTLAAKIRHCNELIASGFDFVTGRFIPPARESEPNDGERMSEPTTTRDKILALIADARKERVDPQAPAEWTIALTTTTYDFTQCDDVDDYVEPIETDHLMEVYIAGEDIHTFGYGGETTYDDEDWIYDHGEDGPTDCNTGLWAWESMHYRLSAEDVRELLAATAKENV